MMTYLDELFPFLIKRISDLKEREVILFENFKQGPFLKSTDSDFRELLPAAYLQLSVCLFMCSWIRVAVKFILIPFQPSLRAMYYLVRHTGYVVKPYQEYPELLNTLLNIISTENSADVR